MYILIKPAHGLQTPDKSILAEQKKLLHKPKTTHGGIPARDAMRSVFAGIKANVTLVSPGKDSN
ncbi:hypothetical protein NQ318_014738 [Aromia moschata]|uniref:Uncharacterized protein n=1 Tax=Aromia moschata TaxID=1265417 RepID=A0AAV8ZB30_9CUCU|nr:hypothetical protein NQ318_014738 [Aromia moschata]